MKINKLHFQPMLGLSSKHLQMAISSKLPGGKSPPSQTQLIELGGGDLLSCEISIPLNWQKTDQTVVLIHGMGGSHSSNYMIRMSRKLFLKEKKVVRVNLRGCGSGVGLSKLPYHAGTSNDILKVLQFLKEQAPLSEISLIGYSLGGNISLKLAGELEAEAEKFVKKFIAVCAPLDLSHTVQLIQEKRNRVYHSYYLRNICSQAKSWVTHPIQSLYEFDEMVTARMWGYKDPSDYYQDCSSIKFLPKIQQTTHLLFAEDDPFVCLSKLQGLSLSNNVHLWSTPKGGHMGFLGKTSKEADPYWMDHLLLNWIEEDFKSNLKIS